MSSSHGTDTPSPSSSALVSASQSPPSPASIVSQITGGAASLFALWKVGSVLPTLAQMEAWGQFGWALVAMVIITAPATAIPIVRRLVPPWLGNNGGK